MAGGGQDGSIEETGRAAWQHKAPWVCLHELQENEPHLPKEAKEKNKDGESSAVQPLPTFEQVVSRAPTFLFFLLSGLVFPSSLSGHWKEAFSGENSVGTWCLPYQYLYAMAIHS